jgi:hypothetical protein
MSTDDEFQDKLADAYKWMGTLPIDQVQHIFTLQQSTITALEVARRDMQQRLEQSEDRLFAVLHRDEGQDYKDGRRYLRHHRPDLYQQLEDGTPKELPAYTIRDEDNVVTKLVEAVTLARDTFSRYGDLHAAKPDDHKATANYLLASKMEAALAAVPK